MNARSALFDVYGDHLRSRGGAAPVAALLLMLAPLDVAAPAVRTAISRMVRQGWLVPVRLDEGAGYRLTPHAERRLSAAATRIYRRGIAPWDGRWHMLVLDRVADRSRRERVRTGLTYLGYAPVGDQTWVGPRASVRGRRPADRRECAGAALLGGPRRTRRRTGRARLGPRGDRPQLRHLARRGAPARRDPDRQLSDEEAFTVRSRLVHEWRKFLFRDPSLPRELLADALAR